ncbi:hypothetical protein C2E23DRAFT_361311 [Lenzites betulinus]|nr:hypothetical protein C2E23DRAFT_361311 [Lenzites betulinus]
MVIRGQIQRFGAGHDRGLQRVLCAVVLAHQNHHQPALYRPLLDAAMERCHRCIGDDHHRFGSHRLEFIIYCCSRRSPMHASGNLMGSWPSSFRVGVIINVSRA